MPAYGGVLGSALTGAATAYLDALLNAPDEEEARLKKQRERERIESQIEVDKANAEWLSRRTNTGRGVGRPIIRQLPDGTHVILDEDTRGFVPIPGSQVRPVKPMDPQKRFDNRQIDILEDHFGKPLESLSQDEINDPAVSKTVDLLRRRGAILWTPDGFVRMDDVRQQMAPTAPAVPAEPRPTTPATPSAPPPVTSPSTTPPPSAAPTGQGPTGEADPVIVKHYLGRWKNKAPEAVESELNILKQDRLTQPVNLASALEAYLKLFPGRTPPGMTVEQAPPGEVPPASPESSAAPGTVISRGGELRTVPTVQTPQGVAREEERRKEEARKAEDQQLQREKHQLEKERFAFDKLKEQRNLREQEARRNLEQVGRVSKEQEMMTSMLFAQGVIKTSDKYPQLTVQERNIVNRYIMEPKRRKEEREALKLAGPSLDELAALDATMELTKLIIPYIQSGNLGWLGAGKSAWTYAKNLMGNSAWWNAAEKSIKDEGWSGPITEAMVKARQAAMIELNDPKVMEMMSPIAPQAALRTLSSILAYTHAMAIKRTGAGTARGVIKSDMDEAHKLFDPSKFFASPDELLTNLLSLQRFIQQARPRLAERIESFHIDPESRQLMDFQLTLEPVPAGEPLAPPAQMTPEEEQLLQGAGKPKPKP